MTDTYDGVVELGAGAALTAVGVHEAAAAEATLAGVAETGGGGLHDAAAAAGDVAAGGQVTAGGGRDVTGYADLTCGGTLDGRGQRDLIAVLTGDGSLAAVQGTYTPAPPRGFTADPADCELLVVQLLTGQVPAGARAAVPLPARVVTDLPADLEGQLPVVQVTEVPGGARITPSYDTTVIDYDCYATDRTSAKLLAAAARLMLLDSAGYITPDLRMWVSRVVEVRRPVLLPYDDNSDVRRFGGSARIFLRFNT